MLKKIKTALISVYHKDGLSDIVDILQKHGVQIYSTGGTFEYISSLGVVATKVEDLTAYPAILDGRVKTLHPMIFGGILAVRDNESHQHELEHYGIPCIDLVIVDLYPFEATVQAGGSESDIIEKIDIGGISLIRAAAKNYHDVLIVSQQQQYAELYSILEEGECQTDIELRRKFATAAFAVSSNYDAAIFNWYDGDACSRLRLSLSEHMPLRYGENPHQKAAFFGKTDDLFTQVHGKAISYNNLLDLDAGLNLINEFDEPAVAVIKHNNACGLATRSSLVDAWKAALAGDPVSAFGGVIVANRTVDNNTANEINKIFFEVIVAPGYTKEALDILETKKNRIILELHHRFTPQTTQVRTALNGILLQDKDLHTEQVADFETVTQAQLSSQQIADLIFANKIVKHTKSNAIVLAKGGQLLASGTGQTSRVDALRQAIDKANSFGFDLHGAVMASDAFFPFNDSVQIAHNAGITAIVQPGGSIRDQDSIDYCNEHNIPMAFTHFRHFKH